MNRTRFEDRPASATVRKIVGPTIILHSGAYFDLLDPENSAFTIEDIAHGLSNTCRFAGQCSHFYSVAQHSVYASQIVPEEHAFAALMHDAAEAFIGDVTKPLKDLLPEYREIEERVEAAIFKRFGIVAPLDPSVKEADLVLLATEQRQLLNNRDTWGTVEGRKALDRKLPYWDSDYAKARFLFRFEELGGRAAA
ncbi:YfbR-like 5'-deoxynucleotidase [Microvirga sp. Mcv34]|uniref:YfbR-like 5'-deoxynucleotidase n=1 Tax=Microvirga sp. Mcv34 TaxID=2926016 RepID=UPI0021CADFBC|nr:YfbR-like 5'-deoxynucleotidase [Microvirga sp. Mcv34]